MKTLHSSGTAFVYGSTSFNEVMKTMEVIKTNDRLNDSTLSIETKKSLLTIIDKFFLYISSEASKMTLFTLVNDTKSITNELFSQNLEEYMYLTVAQNVTSSYNKGIEKVVKDFSEVLIKAQGGMIINNPEPYNLKFKLENGKEYWIDIKTNYEQKEDDRQIIKEKRVIAENEGKEYRLCIYDDEHLSNSEYILNGYDFWTLIAGFDGAKEKVFKLIHGTAKNLSISSIVRETKNKFLNKWRQEC